MAELHELAEALSGAVETRRARRDVIQRINDSGCRYDGYGTYHEDQAIEQADARLAEVFNALVDARVAVVLAEMVKGPP